ncbi:K(+)-insensitive pyrophosphate-energized proton pump [Athalassotoga saccharophila]|nr:sodium-translocating pyrophosphatase [Athalassotoga saccharophila]BBJ27302.1 K(+)-insensitive pyrophosphate-energized proton pump [Athalassotoga saccharophila]
MFGIPEITTFEVVSIWGILIIAIIALLYALILRNQIIKEDKGPKEMQNIWEGIRSGANAYLRKQFRSILPLIVILAVVLFLSVYFVPPSSAALIRFKGMTDAEINLIVGIGRALAFVMGAFFSLAVGQLGMRMAVQGSVRVAAASKKGLNYALKLAYRDGTITGMLTNGLGLLGCIIIFMIFGIDSPDVLLGFGLGGTLLALFMRVGGGIYTKAADVGADLVGKVEVGVPEDDPRNAAVIADLVGDNVGDCAGMAADIFESYEVTIVAALILGVALYLSTKQIMWVLFPLFVRGIGVISSIIGTYLVGVGKEKNAMTSINRGFYVSAVISVIGFALVAIFYMHEWRAFFSVSAGILLALALNEITKYFTDTRYRPVKDIASASRTGAATLILRGLVVGYEATVWQILAIAGAIIAAVGIYWGQGFTFTLYGVAMTGIGMLTLTGNYLGMDSFGPISDNANGLGEMSDMDKESRQNLADLDAVGNTTKAITKGVAIGSAVIAAVSLFGSFLTSIALVQTQMGVPSNQTILAKGIDVSSPIVFVGLLIGGAIPWLFSSLMINAVAKAAGAMVEEVRRQFKIPGLMEGKVKPDYEKPVEISTAAAQRELITLATFVILTPVVVGLVLGEESLGGFLAGAILSSQLLAVFMATSGGAWDNSKKTIEDGIYGGKGSEAHKASVVGDTVGDPLKDTAGPALNPMMKVINLVALIIAPIIIRVSATNPIAITIGILSVIAIIVSVMYSVQGGFKRKKVGEANF